ncbi:MAG: MFS transporter [Planctomycetia bacterium]|nr:MFS transporter [Planctomycetia bacterium]
MNFFKKFSEIFRPQSGAVAFFTSIIIWGIGIGCFAAALNNFLSEIYSVDEWQRGWLEFYREMPGLLLVVLLAILHRVSDWRILRLGTLVSMLAVLGLLIPVDRLWLTVLIVVWSTGEHLVMPIRSSIAVAVARPTHQGESLGLVTATMNAGHILGNIIVALIFWLGLCVFHVTDHETLYKVVWCFIFLLMLISIFTTFTKNAPNIPSRRPRLYVRGKFWRFYILELFYGIRKQIFFTFGPYVLIRVYAMSTVEIAILMGVSATLNMLTSPLIGRLTDRFGYRNIMIYDTIILFFVCLVYGYANQMFAMSIAIWVVCLNYLLDSVLSTCSLATNLYAKRISANGDEFTSSLSTGISVNHLVSIVFAPLGGWIWVHWGIGALFSVAAVAALANSFFAWTIPCHSDREDDRITH